MKPEFELEIIFTDERPDIWHIVRDLVSILHRAETKTREQQEVWNLIIYQAPGLLDSEILFCCLFEEKSDLWWRCVVDPLSIVVMDIKSVSCGSFKFHVLRLDSDINKLSLSVCDGR